MLLPKPFYEHLIGILANYEQVVFAYHLPSQVFRTNKLTVLVRIKDLSDLIDELRKIQGLSGIKVSAKQNGKEIVLQLQNDEIFTLFLQVSFKINGVNYLDIEDVFQSRRFTNYGFATAKEEHLLEFGLLSAYLNRKPVPEEALRYFEEMHILIQEDLLDYVSDKYDADFSAFSEMGDFEITHYHTIVKRLKAMPMNSFFRRVNIRWNPFWRTAKKA